MDLEKLQEVESLFDKAIDLPPAQQKEFIARTKAEDQEIGDMLEDLVRADQTDDASIDSPINTSIAIMNQEKEDFWINKIVGSYKIVSRIAAGGMGTVFLADRVEAEFQHQVAIKIMGVQLLADDALNRFRAERQILAKLSHPYVATLHDGGTTENGLPYLAMEYVEGKHIDDYCIKNNLSIRERLSIFLDICDAVSYLHHNFIVHRDIKPSNIMVDGQGKPKLLDFGIAKLINKDNSLTQTGTLALSFDYASPEQVLGQDISVSTDVYSLGALLYMLLTEEPPHSIAGSTTSQCIDTIVHSTPKKPSHLIREKAKNQEVSTQSNRAIKTLSKDLDTITLKALHKDKDRRYVSVEQFSDDIQRYLDNIPIKARGDSKTYHFTKFCQRNALAVSFSVVLFLALFIFSAITTIQSARIAQEEAKARQEAKTAQQVADFMANIFESSNPYVDGSNLTAREILDQGAVKIENELKDQPAIQARLMNIIGKVYLDMNLIDKAELLVNEAFKINSKLYGEDSIHSISTNHLMGDLAIAKGNLKEGKSYYVKALDLAQSISDVAPLKVAYSKVKVADVLYYDEEKFEEALVLFEGALQTQITQLGERSSQAMRTKRDIMHVYLLQGKLQLSKTIAKKLLNLNKSIHSNPHHMVTLSLNDLAYIHFKLHEYSEAKDLMLEAIDQVIILFGEKHDELVRSYTGLGQIYLAMGEHKNAIKYLQKAATLGEEIFPEDDIILVNIYRSLFQISIIKGDYAVAKQQAQKALEMGTRLSGDISRNVAFTLDALGLFHLSINEFEKSKDVLIKALKIKQKIFEETHPQTAISFSNLAKYYYQNKRFDTASEYHQKSLKIFEKVYTTENIRLMSEKTLLARSFLAQNSVQEADALFSDVLKDLDTSELSKQKEGVEILSILAHYEIQRENVAQSKAYFESVLESMDQFYSPSSTTAIETRFAYAKILIEEDNINKAKQVLKELQKHIEPIYGKDSKRFNEIEEILKGLKKKQAQ